MPADPPEPGRLPSLLIIGAMKSGTTTLYRDLVDRANVFLAENKEPHALCDEAVLTPEGRRAYAAWYRGATPGEALCDASTGYTKLPDHAGVVERAVAVLPPGFKVVYLVRNPIERTLSHFRHEYVRGDDRGDPNDAIRQRPDYLHYSRYAMQLRPWLDALGLDRVRVYTFERFVEDRAGVVDEIAAFAGLRLREAPTELTKAYNQSKTKPRLDSWWSVVRRNPIYRYLIRPLAPLQLRLKVAEVMAPKADLSAIEIGAETRDWLREQLAPDAAQLAQMLGREPLWPELAEPSAVEG